MNAGKQAASANFSFLAKRYPQLERIGAQSERYFSDDPIVSLITTRQFGEALAQLAAARRTALEMRRELMQAWADHCERLCGKPPLTS
jgi:type I restriction enzyme, R subunit